MDTRVQVVNIKKAWEIWRTPCSNSEDPLGVPDPLLKTPALGYSLAKQGLITLKCN